MSTYDIKGGAARAAYHLHRSLLAIGIDSCMLVHKKHSSDRTVVAPQSKWYYLTDGFRHLANGLPLRRYNRKALFTPSWVPSRGLARMIDAIGPDIVHLHFIGDDMLKIEELKKIKQPLVWSLHDMWPLTGGCHYDAGCGRYREQCGRCPVLSSSLENDLSRRVFLRKLKVYAELDQLSLIGTSRWLTGCIGESALLSDKKTFTLPNPLDLAVFRPLDKMVARDLLDLPRSKKLVFFGAVGATADVRKGYKELTGALKMLKPGDIELVVIGAVEPATPPDFGHPARYLGFYHDEMSLRILYSAADVLVVPSLQENLSNMIMESLACGTPVVAFDIGGNPDMIDHKQTGYLARAFDLSDLAGGIDWVLSNKEREELSARAVKKVKDCYEMSFVADQYRLLYEKITGKSESR